MPISPLPVSLTPLPARYDLRALLTNPSLRPGAAPTATDVAERPMPDSPAELLDDQPLRITCEPLGVAAWVDGVQHTMSLGFRDRRPLLLSYVGAGGVDSRGQLVGLSEALTIICAACDSAAATELIADPPPVRTVPDGPLPQVERAVVSLPGVLRDESERRLTEDLLAQAGTTDRIVVDGALAGRAADPRVCGVVKTVATRFLADESVLYRLPLGWRSPRFIIPAGTSAGHVERYSCYLRLTDAPDTRWTYGLIRLEAHDPDLLEPLAAAALQMRQPAGSGDRRGDRHLAPIAHCERVLRSRLPAAFDVQR